MADIFDEVADDLRAERARALARRWVGPLVALVLLAVAGAGGWEWWRNRQAGRAGAVAGAFIAAERMADAPGADRAGAIAALDRVAATAPAGYRALARLREAALKAANGDLPGALALYDALAADKDADPVLRDLASLLSVQRQVDTADRAALEARLAVLVRPDGPWRDLAEETRAWVLLRAGDKEGARGLLRRLANDPAAPQGVRGRAGGLLARLGEDAAPAPPAAVPGAGG